MTISVSDVHLILFSAFLFLRFVQSLSAYRVIKKMGWMGRGQICSVQCKKIYTCCVTRQSIKVNVLMCWSRRHMSSRRMLSCCLFFINMKYTFYVFFYAFSDKYTRFCQWKNLELNIQVRTFYASNIVRFCILRTLLPLNMQFLGFW